MLINHVDLRRTVGPGGFDAVQVGELVAVIAWVGRGQLARDHGRTSTDDKRRRL
jgi:hypothetical protein